MSDFADATEEITALTTETDESYSAYLAAKQERDDAIRQAIAQGMTMYQLAKITGMSQTSIAKIRDKANDRQ